MAPGGGARPVLTTLLLVCLAIDGTSGLLPSFPNRVAASRRSLVTCKGGDLPTSVKVAISDMTAATQAALQSRCSRMDVELPPGVELGVEKGSKATSGLFNEGGDADAAIASVMRSDRELARLYVEMFSSIRDAVTVAFSSTAEMEAALDKWGKGTRLMALDGGVGAKSAAAKKKKKASAKRGGSGGGGFGAKLAAATAPAADAPKPTGVAPKLPEGTEVLVVVAPKGEGNLKAVEAICRDVGMGTCVILLNARLEGALFASPEQRDYFLDAFEPVFHLKPPPPASVQDAKALTGGKAPTPIISRTYPHEWKLYSKPTIGSPKLLAAFKERPGTMDVVQTLTEAAQKEPEGFTGQLDALVGKFIKN